MLKINIAKTAKIRCANLKFSHIYFTNGETIIIVDFPELRAAFARRGNSWKIKLFRNRLAEWQKHPFHEPNLQDMSSAPS